MDVDYALSTVGKLGAKLPAAYRANGVDVGYKRVSSRPTGTLSIRFFVDEKRPLRALRDEERIPGQLEGVPTDVIEETFRPLTAIGSHPDAVAGNRGHFITLIGGISIGLGRVTGTLGCRVTDARNQNGGTFLSNAHVLSPGGKRNSRITQPSREDGGRAPRDYCATEQRTVPVVPEGRGVNRVDASLAVVTPGRRISDDIFQLGVLRGTSQVKLGDPVRKCGRTTGITAGIVDGLGHRNLIPYPRFHAAFVDQIHIRPEPFSCRLCEPGDSGSVFLDAEMRVIGLLFAGGAVDALANPIFEVQNQLGVIVPIGST